MERDSGHGDDCGGRRMAIERSPTGLAVGLRRGVMGARARVGDPYAAQRRALRLIPGFFRSARWVPIVGWLMVLAALLGVLFGALGVALGGYLYEDDGMHVELAGLSVETVILLVSAVLTLGIALPAMIARRRTDSVWPLRWLRNAALIFTLLNALVDFAIEGFGALINLSIGLFTLAVLSSHLDIAARSGAPDALPATAPAHTAR